MRMRTVIWFLCGVSTMCHGRCDEVVGERPYEMVWANRTEDTHPPLVDFELVEGWKIETNDATATFTRSREQQLWGKYVGKLVYRSTGPRPSVTICPPKPIEISQPFDCVNFWVYGNNWAWQPDRTTPQVGIEILLRTEDGETMSVGLGRVRWKEWWVMHKKLSGEELEALSRGAAFEGIRITNCRNTQDRVLYFDNIAFYREELPPLTFEPRPKRGIDMFPGQGCGTNTGPGRLPFPNREETILPDNLTKNFKTTLKQEGDAFVFRYKGEDGVLEYRYEPKTGTLGDVTVKWGQFFGKKFSPMVDGGVRFAVDVTSVPPERFELLGCDRVEDTVVARWRLGLGNRTTDCSYTFRLCQKSLVIDVKCLGGDVAEFAIGRAVGLDNPRLVTNPYLVGERERPAVLVIGKPDDPLFVTGLMDYYRSNASVLFFANEIQGKTATYNGGSRYLPKTDGKLNDCFERLFLTVSPRFEEILPNIPNPKSPWMQVTGERLWRAHGASDRERDYETWKEIARYGMTKVVITDHETGWRDGGESFTFRTRTAPKKGGDESQKEYSRKLHALGFRYGIYNNYTDYAPVNEHWHEDRVNRFSDGNWQAAWPRCYAPKPARAVEFEAKLTPIIQKKFNLSTAYCDVHTAVMPWSRVDYDARVPGAGTFAAQFYSYGEIMLHQKKVWNGPVYSEGNNHYYYCGLTDGNYAQDQRYDPAKNPWLVDFDLRKMHPLCCNFGMGNIGMFYGKKVGLGTSPEEHESKLDRFLAATIAFGHTGFLVREGGMQNAVRSYFLLQQLHKDYAQEVATEILYANERGKLLDTSAAVATRAYTRSQIRTTYSNGLRVWVNGSQTENWQIGDVELPPNGWYATSADGRLVAISALKDDHRADYVDSRAYIYVDGRGKFARFEKGASDGQLIAHKRNGGQMEVIPVGACEDFAISLDGKSAKAVALDKEGNEIGPAEARLSRGLVYVVPFKDAFSYLLTPAAAPDVQLVCERDAAVPGEQVVVEGREKHNVSIPPDARPGTRVWRQLEGAWIDFAVLPLADAALTFEKGLRLTLKSNLHRPAEGNVVLAGIERSIAAKPGVAITLDFPYETPATQQVKPLQMVLMLDGLRFERTWWLKAEKQLRTLRDLVNSDYETGQGIRGQRPIALGGETGASVSTGTGVCGSESRHALLMHPPYKRGVGYAYALFEPILLPREPAAAFRCEIGKGDGSDPGDGILFRVAVVDSKGEETVIAEKQWIQHAWTPLEGNLSRWAGKKIRIKLIADVGPDDNSSGDWARWSKYRIESVQRVMEVSIHEQPTTLHHQAGPSPIPKLKPEDLRSANKGWLHFEGMGLQAGGQYISEGKLNGVSVGTLPASIGCSEAESKWSPVLSVGLPPQAIKALRTWNTFAIINPGGDCFKVRRFWVELELADGRKCSSMVNTDVYSQPPNWLYAEGTCVPLEKNIELDILFDGVEGESEK